MVYTSALQGTATLDVRAPGSTILPLLDTVLEQIPGPEVSPDAPLQMLVLALAYDGYKGKLGIGKLQSGSMSRRQDVVQIKRDGTRVMGKVAQLSIFSGLERVDVERVEAGEIVAVAGLPDIGIGETIADPLQPMALPPVAIDEPTVQMTFAVNTSPFAGKEGKYLTSRHLRDRLLKELETNVSLRVEDTDSPDRFLVAGRGELHLAVLIEQMRGEGYELQVSQPEVILRTENGVLSEPIELLAVQVPAEYQGTVIEDVSARRGELQQMKIIQSEDGNSDSDLSFTIPTRGLIGLKQVLLTRTRGTVIMHHVFQEYRPVRDRADLAPAHGSLVAFEDGISNAYALHMIQERGSLFIGPGVEVYRGMVVGQNSRDEDLDVNVCKTKHLTNMRASGSDEALTLTPPRQMTLENAIEYIGPDELVEVTPASIRIRKRLLHPEERRKARKDRRGTQ